MLLLTKSVSVHLLSFSQILSRSLRQVDSYLEEEKDVEEVFHFVS